MCLLQDITAFNKFRHFSFFLKNSIEVFKQLLKSQHVNFTEPSQSFSSSFHYENDLAETGKCKRKGLSTKTV